MWGSWWDTMLSTQMMPSSSALWANIGPWIQSPMAKMPLQAVWKCLSTSIRPRLSSWIPRKTWAELVVNQTPSPKCLPTDSRPRLFVYGRRPMQTRTVSQSSYIKQLMCWWSTHDEKLKPFLGCRLLLLRHELWRLHWSFQLPSL